MNSTLPRLQHSAGKRCLALIGSSGSPTSGIRRTKVRQIPRGFTIVELAVTLVIIALLLGSILVPLNTQIESRNYDQTQRILDQAREALLGYAAATGRFPCPASTNGAEAFFSPPVGNSGNGLCDTSVTGAGGMNVYVGFLPAVTLGLTPVDATGFALDAWGLTQNRIRYAVSYQTVNSIARPFTTLPNPANTTGMRAAGMSNIMNAALLNVCSAAPVPASTTACSPASTTLASNAIAVIWSLGPNAATSGGVSADEAKNAQGFTSADRVFVMHTKSGAAGSEFDDIVTWISPPMVFNRLVASGQLP